jgi:hypothetical protein
MTMYWTRYRSIAVDSAARACSCQGHLVFGFRLVVPGSATLRCGFRSRAGARRSQGKSARLGLVPGLQVEF